ncbi:MAG TPA: SET domain-containing protein [Candidatus Paceibacterota bacterium]|nr:SET domain-containing protein [Candidatus Paceibacterota bacterium]
MFKIKKIKHKDVAPIRLKVAPSLILKGEVGLFSVVSIRKNDLVCESSKMQDDFFCEWKEFDKIDDNTKITIHDFCLGDEFGFYTMKDMNYMPIVWYMNHSCDGNVGFDVKNNFVAMRDIEPGEELCWDYGLAEKNPDFMLKCKCGSKKCRKLITGHDWLDNVDNEYRFKF